MKKHLAILLLAALLGACAAAPDGRDVRQLSGVEMYEQLCASCHGPTAHGDGPVASLITVRVPDLTRIAKRDGGEFPADDVRRTIDGRWDRRAHGARDMPVWGWEFYDASTTDDARERAAVDSMIDRLVGYLRSIQQE